MPLILSVRNTFIFPRMYIFQGRDRSRMTVSKDKGILSITFSMGLEFSVKNCKRILAVNSNVNYAAVTVASISMKLDYCKRE